MRLKAAVLNMAVPTPSTILRRTQNVTKIQPDGNLAANLQQEADLVVQTGTVHEASGSVGHNIIPYTQHITTARLWGYSVYKINGFTRE